MWKKCEGDVDGLGTVVESVLFHWRDGCKRVVGLYIQIYDRY